MNERSPQILRIPFAIDDTGRLNSPTEAEKVQSYFCPSCHGSVILKKGAIRTPHFAHRVSEACNQETITHKTAKLLVQKVVREWKLGKSNPPELRRECQICGEMTGQPLPQKVDDAILEYKLPDGSIADVALLSGCIAQAAVEIRVTHAVDETKADRLSIPYIELDGYKVIETPTIWDAVTDNFKPLTCAKCKSSYSAFQIKTEQIAMANNLELPKAYFRYGFCKCWKCKREIIVFDWPKNGMWDNASPKVKLRPRTIQYRYTKTTGGKYWANTCPYCQSVQGDFFLHGFPDGPFPMDIEEDSAEAFNNDMMRIANFALQRELYKPQTPPP